MNERIKLLADEAGFVLWADESWNPGDVIDWSCRYDTEFKKFAVLIVKQCAGVAEVSMSISSHPDDRLTVKNSVLKHFGVEE